MDDSIQRTPPFISPKSNTQLLLYYILILGDLRNMLFHKYSKKIGFRIGHACGEIGDGQIFLDPYVLSQPTCLTVSQDKSQ